MPALPQHSPRMASPHPRWRATLWWGGFGLVALATAIAVFRLYDTVRREFDAQSRNARAQAFETTRALIDAQTHELRISTIKALASFHVEGLAHALRRWDEAEPHVTGTFQWDPVRGFPAGTALPAGLSAADLAAVWTEFRSWRAREPDAEERPAARVGRWRTYALRTIDQPLLPNGELGYQAENLEILNYARRPTDPWAGSAALDGNPGHSWMFWYQVGPDAPVRGCWVEIAPLLRDVAEAIADRDLARLELVPQPLSSPDPAAQQLDLSTWLPGYTLVATEGDFFAQKQSGARLAAVAVVLLLAVFLLGAAALALYSRREARDAQRKAAFLTQVSHELRTPLTSIQMFAEMLATPDLALEKRTRFAGTISRESQRLGELIERLLTFGTLGKAARPPPLATVDVAATTQQTLEQMEPALQAAGLALTADYPATPVQVHTDRSALKQALLNLLDNARKYARTGGTVRVAVIRESTLVRVIVADEGPGIPRELGERAFEPFVQGGRTLTDKSPGVGLGLSIARGLLRQAGGDLVLLPSAIGACFEIRLPTSTA